MGNFAYKIYNMSNKRTPKLKLISVHIIISFVIICSSAWSYILNSMRFDLIPINKDYIVISFYRNFDGMFIPLILFLSSIRLINLIINSNTIKERVFVYSSWMMVAAYVLLRFYNPVGFICLPIYFSMLIGNDCDFLPSCYEIYSNKFYRLSIWSLKPLIAFIIPQIIFVLILTFILTKRLKFNVYRKFLNILSIIIND